MSIIVFLFSVILCNTVTGGELKVPFLGRDMEVGQTLEEVPSEEVGNRRRFYGRRSWRFNHCGLYSRRGRNEVYLYLDRECHHIPDRSTFNRLFTSWSAIRKVPGWRWPRCRHGRTISRDAFLGQAYGRHAVYLFSNGVKRHIVNRRTMRKCNFNGGRIKRLSSSYVDRTRTSFIIRSP